MCLTDQQFAALEEQFVSEGGYSEQLAVARLKERNRTKGGGKEKIPPCPKCSKPMVLRTAKTGMNAGHQFWGCSAYPECKGVVEV